MPRFNPFGDIAAGVGGDGHYLSINRLQALPAPSSCIGWITPSEVASNLGGYTRIVARHVDGSIRKLYSGPSLATRVGGGRWAVEVMHGDWLLDDGSRTALAVEGFGAEDGCLVTWAWEGGGLIIGGNVIESTALCTGIQVFNAGCALWQQGGYIRTIGMPSPHVLPGVAQNFRACLHNGRWWGIYQSTHNDRLVAHPFDGPQTGYVLNAKWGSSIEGNAYRPDLCSVNGRLLATWAVVESEFPDQVRSADVLSLPLVDLTANDPIPEPEPEPEPQPMPDPESLLPTVQAVRAKYPTPPANTDLGKMLNEIAWTHRAEGWGVNLKPSGNSTMQPGTGIRIAVDILHHKPSDTIWDCFRDAGGETVPTWGEAEPHGDPARVWVAPVKPDGVEPDPDPDPVPVPEPGPEPVPSGVFGEILMELRKLNRHLGVP